MYAEDPSRGDLPQAGPLRLYREPSMPGIRVDAGVVEGDVIGVHYDPMIAKLIATGESREDARGRALAALRDFPILGIRTNVPFLIQLLEHPRFIAGDIGTAFLDTEGEALRASSVHPPTPEALAVAAHLRSHSAWPVDPGAAGTASDTRWHQDPWASLRGVRV